MSEEPLSRAGTARALGRAIAETPALRKGLGVTVAFAGLGTLIQLVVPIAIQQVIDNDLLGVDEVDVGSVMTKGLIALLAMFAAFLVRRQALVRLANVAGIPITELLTEEKINEIVKRTQMGGIEIVNHLKTGSAFYAPGLSAIEMAEAIVKDTKRVLPCAAYLEGEFGISGCFLGVPVVLGEKGVERIVEFALTDEEKTSLNESVAAVQNQMAATGL